MSQGLNEIKCKITSKLQENLKLNPYPNYAAVLIKFCLFISLEWLALVCFWNEQLQPADWNYALEETRFNNVVIQREFQTLWKSFCNVHVPSNQTVWEIKLLLFIEQKKAMGAITLQFLSMLYIIWVKLLYSNLIQRNVTI